MPVGYVRRERDIVIVRPPPVVDGPVVTDLLRELERPLAGRAPYGLLFDLTGAGVPGAPDRRRLAEHITENESRIRRLVRGMAVVTSSPALRGALTATLWITPLPVAHRVFSDQAAAIEWLESQLAAPYPSPGAAL